MKKSRSGFTIVELLIVIVVIGILAAITIVAYNGIQTRAENTKTIKGVSDYIKVFMSYKAVNGNYPSSGATYACLGTDYAGGVCMTATDGTTPVASISATLNQALTTMASLPQPSVKVLTLSSGQKSAGANYEQGAQMIRYYLSGASQQCTAGGTGYNYGNVTECRLTLN